MSDWLKQQSFWRELQLLGSLELGVGDARVACLIAIGKLCGVELLSISLSKYPAGQCGSHS